MTFEESESLIEETTKLNPSPIVELFELDLRPVGEETILYFHNGSSGLREQVTFKGVNYQPLPISITGFQTSGDGTPARPTMSIMNFNGFVSALVLSTGDLVGAVVVRRRTYQKYLDENNASAFKPEFAPDIFVVEQKTSEERRVVQFELGTGFDLDGFRFPNRDVIGSYCRWNYRGPGCAFGGRVAIANLYNTLFAGGSNYRGVWSASTVYFKYDCVEFEDTDGYWKAFECTYVDPVDHLPLGGIIGDDYSPSASPSNWVERQRWRGTWVDQAYSYLDVVQRVVPIYGVSRVAPADEAIIVAIAKADIVAGTPAPPNSQYWDTDSCSKLIVSCRYRFDGKFGNAPLPFGGQPGTLQMPADL